MVTSLPMAWMVGTKFIFLALNPLALFQTTCSHRVRLLPALTSPSDRLMRITLVLISLGLRGEQQVQA
jgi:hypothetical protein